MICRYHISYTYKNIQNTDQGKASQETKTASNIDIIKNETLTATGQKNTYSVIYNNENELSRQFNQQTVHQLGD